ncbi:hypothetical protein C9374_003050 [Naegleria lovaniensis]|uniref:N-acetyltransferase domain-containing protein n=1 Tax=Naegleria lovaniensis TaxID=51637 RepID=A0AA88KM05_NAELO|nr:uncharacterized protein C9374_003050 [Naegleria lovaniensis]KAG2385901.1 hypothetical protein C9374_003050 [Naegleria lovaniensis]
MSLSVPLTLPTNSTRPSYSITFYTNAELFYEHAIPFLTKHLAENNLILGVSRSCVITPQRYPERFLMIIHSSHGTEDDQQQEACCNTDSIVLVMAWTIPHRLLLSAPTHNQTLEERQSILSAWMDLVLNGSLQDRGLNENSEHKQAPCFVEEIWEEIEKLLKKHGRAVSGVLTDNSEAEWFAKEYCEKLKKCVSSEDGMNNFEIREPSKLRIYSLKAQDIRPCRDLETQQKRYEFSYLDLNNEKQLDMYIQCLDEFMNEIFPDHKKMSKEEYMENLINRALKDGFAPLCYEKDDKDKLPISVALVNGIPKAGRVSYVYTSKKHRGKGVASFLMYSLVHDVLVNHGDIYEALFLFTDLSNPTSNSVYMNIGFKPVRDMYDQEIKYSNHD